MFAPARSLMVVLAFQGIAGALTAGDTEPPTGVSEALPAISGSAPPANNAVGPGPKVTTWDPVQRTIKYEYRVMNPTSRTVGKIDVFVPLPLESPRQEIHYLRLSERGRRRIFTDVHGQRLAHYSLDGLEPGEWVDLGFVAGLTLKNMRWNATGQSADQDAPALTPEQRARYLKSETNYSMDAELMRKTAAELIHGTATDFDKLTRIHDYIIGKIRYVRDNTWDPAAVVLARGTGSCSEYNYVLSGLCRLAGLPTRCVGGSTNGFRPLPTTDAVFHRWTEIFLSGYGWFPADCSRDANPIRGKRSHFGRVYTDAVVWCRQAGGEEDSLGWEYRAKARVTGDDPGIRQNHRTRWFVFYPEEQIGAADAWFLSGAGTPPTPDLLECALLRWDTTPAEHRVKMIRALAAGGRNVCLYQAASLPETDGLREACVRELCDSPELANTILDRSRNPYRFRSWFKTNEPHLVPTVDGRFTLTTRTEQKDVPFTTAASPQIWPDLAAELIDRLADSVDMANDRAVVVMPVEDQSLAGLGEQRFSIHATLKDLISRKMDVRLIDEIGFDRLMEERGPGSKEYWALANGDRGDIPAAMVPDVILVPVCITARPNEENGAVLHHIEFKTLECSSRRYTQIVARRYRRPDDG